MVLIISYNITFTYFCIISIILVKKKPGEKGRKSEKDWIWLYARIKL